MKIGAYALPPINRRAANAQSIVNNAPTFPPPPPPLQSSSLRCSRLRDFHPRRFLLRFKLSCANLATTRVPVSAPRETT